MPWASRYVLEVSILAHRSVPGARVSAADRGATRDYSTENSGSDRPGGRQFSLHIALRAALAVAGLAGVVLLVVATFSTIIEINVVTTREIAANVDTRLSGEDRHGVALIVIAGAALLMLAGALRGAKPAMLGLAALGITALAITVGGDAPDIDDTGVIGQLYDSASAGAGIGFYLETLGAALLLIAGGGLLVLGSGEPEEEPSTPSS